MATTITIPKFNAPAPGLSLPQPNIDANPYASLASGIDQLSAAVVRRDALDAELRDAAAVADFQEFIADNMAQGGFGPGFAADADRRLREKEEEIYRRAASPAERERWRTKFAPIRLDAMRLWILGESDGRKAQRVSQARQTVNNLIERAYSEPDDIGAIRDDLDQTFDQLSPDEQARFGESKRQLNEAYLQGLIEKNPKLALETLRSRKGAAEEDLGVSEETRAWLEEEAALALEEEERAAHAATPDAFIHAITHAEAMSPFDDDVLPPPIDYGAAIRALKLGVSAARQVETKIDGAQERRSARVGNAIRAGRIIAQGKGAEWNDDTLRGLDDHIRAVAQDDEPARAWRRRAATAKLARVVPPGMRRDLMTALHADDLGERALAARALLELDAHGDGDLTAWLPADARHTVRAFDALTNVGFGEAAAFARVDAGRALTSAQREARGDYFDRFIGEAGVRRALEAHFGGSIAEEQEDRRWSEDSSADGGFVPSDAPAATTLEYRPGEEPVEAEPLLLKDGGRIRFTGQKPGDAYGAPGPHGLPGPNGYYRYPATFGFIFTDKKRPVRARRNDSGERRLDSNCFGYALAEGKFWIQPRGAETILEDDYAAIGERDLRPGDVVVYRDEDGEPVHAAIVTQVSRDPRGRTTGVRVKGKRGTYDVEAR